MNVWVAITNLDRLACCLYALPSCGKPMEAIPAATTAPKGKPSPNATQPIASKTAPSLEFCSQNGGTGSKDADSAWRLLEPFASADEPNGATDSADLSRQTRCSAKKIRSCDASFFINSQMGRNNNAKAFFIGGFDGHLIGTDVITVAIGGKPIKVFSARNGDVFYSFTTSLGHRVRLFRLYPQNRTDISGRHYVLDIIVSYSAASTKASPANGSWAA